MLLLVLVGIFSASTFFIPSVLSSEQMDIYVQLRLPKYGIAFFAGACLSIAGYLSQLLLNNPLAEPYVLGVSGGAGVGVNLATFLGLPVFALGGFFMPYLFAFIGSSLVAFLLFYKLNKQVQNLTGILILGITINFFASACVSLMIYLSKDSNMIRDISFWFMGSYNKVSLVEFGVVALISLVLMVYVQTQHTALYKLHLGLRRVEELGVNTKRLYRMGVILIVLFSTLIVCACGPIGFVGLLVPHFVRSFKLESKYLFITCFLMGGVLTLGAELLSSLLFPQSLPPGVITAMLGIPVFLYLLRNNYRFHL